MTKPKDIEAIEHLIACGYSVPGFRLVRDPYSEVGAEMIHRIGFLVGDVGRTANDDEQLVVLDRALKYLGIDLGWEPVQINADLQRADDMRFTPITIKDTT